MPNAKIVAPPSPATQARADVVGLRDAAAAATTVPQLRDQVARLAAIVETLLAERTS